MQTEIIRYNLADRGRKFRGKERHFNIPQIVRMINSGPTQEKVKHRDMLGYFGHWPRVKFGMNPAEGGIVDGKAVAVEPAMVTTYLSALPDGTIEHRAEFLDTVAGKIAQRMYASKTGGFSSAIDERRPEFFGFDYVMEPNFTFNRGYDLALDNIDVTFDDVAIQEYNQQLVGVLGLLDSLNGEHERILDANKFLQETINRLADENQQYIDMLARDTVALDALEAVTPYAIDPSERSLRMRNIKSFHTAELARIEVPEKPESATQARDRRLVTKFAP